MTTPLISIVIDNFNYARFLVQCIDSALAQTHPRIEVVVVDDASTDDSRSLIERYAGRVTAVYQSVNRGQGAAFNAGFAVCHGDIVLFLDSDDWLYPEAAAKIAAAWVPGESKTHFRLDLVDVLGRRIDVHPAPEVRLDRGDVVPLLLEFGRYETVVTSGNAFARSALESNLPIPEESFRIAADGYLATVVPFHGPVTCIEECLGAYRVHGSNAYAAEGNSAPASTASIAALCARARKFLAHDEQKESALRGKVTAAGLHLSGIPKMRDPSHLELRLASLRLDPVGHPYRQDTGIELALRGIAASRRARLSGLRRALLASWFLVGGMLPSRLAVTAIQWKLLPATRPAGIDRNVKRIRRLLQ